MQSPDIRIADQVEKPLNGGHRNLRNRKPYRGRFIPHRCRPFAATSAGALRLPAYRFGLRPAIVASQDFEESTMNDRPTLSLAEIDRRIAIARDNIRQLIEQAAAFSGAEDEDRNADRIAHQTEELEKLIKQRDALQQK
jgi:hypothetical protein